MNSDIREFLSVLNSDAAMQRELVALHSGRNRHITADDLMSFAAARGYRIDVREMDEELDEESLDAVSGGIGLLLPAVQKVILQADPKQRYTG